LTTDSLEHHAVASAVSSIASWDFDSTPTHSVPTTPKHRKISNLFLDPIVSDQDEFQLPDEVLFEGPERVPSAPNNSSPPFAPDTDGNSDPNSERAETESSTSSSLPSTPPGRSLEADILTTAASNPPTPTGGGLGRKQSGTWWKLSGPKRVVDSASPPQSHSISDKSGSFKTRTLGSRFLNNR
jgi:hypothetical protein